MSKARKIFKIASILLKLASIFTFFVLPLYKKRKQKNNAQAKKRQDCMHRHPSFQKEDDN